MKHPLRCGVPQGSLGPILHPLYTSSLSDIKLIFSLSYHYYIDVSHPYFSIQPTIPGDRDLAMSKMECCPIELNHWMLVNSLKSKQSQDWTIDNLHQNTF